MPQLDALRFFAVIGVMLTHNWELPRFPWIFSSVDLAELGVRLFFVLSGFLITGILLKCRDLSDASSEGEISFVKRFYIRRFLRIFPLYYAVLAILLLINFPPTRQVWSWLATYTSNIYITQQSHWLGRIGHFWSLAVEEQFYFFWPWIVMFIPRKWLAPLIALIIFLAPAYRYITITKFPDEIMTGSTRNTFTLSCLDSLGAGALLALFFHSKIQKETARKYLRQFVLPIGVIAFVAIQAIYYYKAKTRLFYTLNEMSTSIIFCWLVGSASLGFSGRVGKLLEYRPLVYLGKITYGIYIYHNLVPAFLASLFSLIGITYPVSGALSFFISSAVTILIAHLSWQWFEHPINELKDRFPYSSSRKPIIEKATAQ